jgi:hypothetical protein
LSDYVKGYEPSLNEAKIYTDGSTSYVVYTKDVKEK